MCLLALMALSLAMTLKSVAYIALMDVLAEGFMDMFDDHKMLMLSLSCT